MTDWGREIAVNGVRPAWLGDNDPYMPSGKFMWYNDARCEKDRTSKHLSWDHTVKIRLPADDWAYRALDAGFEPWGGGDNAPDDWDGGLVLLRGGGRYNGPKVWQWFDNRGDIIGYHRKSELTLRTSDEALRRMEALVRRMAARSRAIPGGPIETDHAEAREIVRLLPKPPVDPDRIEAIKLCNGASYDLTGAPDGTNEQIIQLVVSALRRGRELAAGE